MKKELRILVILIAVLLVGTVGYYFMPKKFGKNVNPSEVDHINVFDGNTGTGFTITDSEDIEYIVANIQGISMKRDGISLGRSGYSFKISYINSNDKNIIPVFILNSDNTMIISSPPLNTRDYKTDNITSRLKYDYTVQNDARASAFADYWYSHKNENAHMDESYHDKFYLMINDGVGGACVSNDKIVQGEHNRYGEFGHMTLYPDGRKCMCGKKGCVESYLSARNLSSDLGIQIDEFFKKASEGDAQCVKVLDEYLDNLTTGINNLYVIFDRDIVIGGFVSRYLLEYEENIRQRLIDKYSFDTDGRYFSISSCTSERTDTGAAIMFLSEFINSI